MMQFFSTNHNAKLVSFREAVMKGLPEDNGLYLPMHIPELDRDFLNNLDQANLQEIGYMVTRALAGDELDENTIRKIVEESIDFDAPLHQLEENIYSLELYHGPTYAFKDFGARFMARTVTHFLGQEDKKITILVATSGDTGSAVANGFYNAPNVRVVLLYPSNKVSELQEKQLTTLGGNVTALEIEGTFDDCQIMVKQAFLDQDLKNSINLTSANSINIARLIPQSFYYFYAYGKLADKSKPVYFSVPSGNLGNLCGGVLAHKMGLPCAGFVAATNANNTVPKYLSTGKFTPKASVRTISNAMDVGNPSNFPRILELYGQRHEAVKNEIAGFAYSDSLTKKTIQKVYKMYEYLICPHSAVGYMGIHDYLIRKNEDATGIFLSTAHPAKFYDIIDKIIGEDITFPHALKSILSKEKKSFPLSTDYQVLKEFLLNLHGIV
jgi:threonine synthase